MRRKLLTASALLVATTLAFESHAGDYVLEIPILVEEAGVPIEQEASMPLVIDWNSDGKKDLLVGWFNDAANGKIFVYLNDGTDAEPVFNDHSNPVGETTFDGG